MTIDKIPPVTYPTLPAVNEAINALKTGCEDWTFTSELVNGVYQIRVYDEENVFICYF